MECIINKLARTTHEGESILIFIDKYLKKFHEYATNRMQNNECAIWEVVQRKQIIMLFLSNELIQCQSVSFSEQYISTLHSSEKELTRSAAQLQRRTVTTYHQKRIDEGTQ